eukprot:g15280.t1
MKKTKKTKTAKPRKTAKPGLTTKTVFPEKSYKIPTPMETTKKKKALTRSSRSSDHALTAKTVFPENTHANDVDSSFSWSVRRVAAVAAGDHGATTGGSTSSSGSAAAGRVDENEVNQNALRQAASFAEREVPCGQSFWKPAGDPPANILESLADAVYATRCPFLATVTYLTQPGMVGNEEDGSNDVNRLSNDGSNAFPPTIVLDVPPFDHAGGSAKNILQEKKTASKALLSYPRIGKHLAFSGNFLHGIPAEFAVDVGASGKAAKKKTMLKTPATSDGKTKAQRKAERPQKRITFLANLWLDCDPPRNVKRYEEWRRSAGAADRAQQSGSKKKGTADRDVVGGESGGAGDLATAYPSLPPFCQPRESPQESGE